MLNELAVTVAEPTFAPTLLPVRVTVHVSPEHTFPAVHVVECALPSYIHDAVPHVRVTSLAFTVNVPFVFVTL